MTIEQLLDLDADGWDKINDEELSHILKPFLKVSRPSLEYKSPDKKSTGKKASKVDTNQLLLMAQKILKDNEKNN